MSRWRLFASVFRLIVGIAAIDAYIVITVGGGTVTLIPVMFNLNANRLLLHAALQTMQHKRNDYIYTKH